MYSIPQVRFPLGLISPRALCACPTPHGYFSPTWSPNSMRIAFNSLTNLIWAIDIDGSNLVELTNGLGGRRPAWQPVVPSAAATSVEDPVVGDRSSRCFLINRASCVGAVRGASRPYTPFCINPRLTDPCSATRKHGCFSHTTPHRLAKRRPSECKTI